MSSLAEPSISKPVTIEYVKRWFYTDDGRRAAGQLVDGNIVMVSSLASREWQQRAIADAVEFAESDDR